MNPSLKRAPGETSTGIQAEILVLYQRMTYCHKQGGCLWIFKHLWWHFFSISLAAVSVIWYVSFRALFCCRQWKSGTLAIVVRKVTTVGFPFNFKMRFPKCFFSSIFICLNLYGSTESSCEYSAIFSSKIRYCYLLIVILLPIVCNLQECLFSNHILWPAT